MWFNYYYHRPASNEVKIFAHRNGFYKHSLTHCLYIIIKSYWIQKSKRVPHFMCVFPLFSLFCHVNWRDVDVMKGLFLATKTRAEDIELSGKIGVWWWSVRNHKYYVINATQGIIIIGVFGSFVDSSRNHWQRSRCLMNVWKNEKKSQIFNHIFFE